MDKISNNFTEKNILYQEEISYCMSVCLAQMYWSDKYENVLYKYGMAIIKPEAIMLGKVNDILSIIKTAGFEIVYISQKTLTEEQTNQMWKYSWTDASIERILINQKLFSVCFSIILVLRYKFDMKMSACEILTELKGGANPEKRKPHQIRSLIKPINLILNYIHSSDEIADFIREIGILFNWDEVVNIYKLISSDNKISFCYKEQEPIYLSEVSLKIWLKNIYCNIEKINVNYTCKMYIENVLKQLANRSDYKIPLRLLQILCKYNLIDWDFETIVILSNHIKYMR